MSWKNIFRKAEVKEDSSVNDAEAVRLREREERCNEVYVKLLPSFLNPLVSLGRDVDPRKYLRVTYNGKTGYVADKVFEGWGELEMFRANVELQGKGIEVKIESPTKEEIRNYDFWQGVKGGVIDNLGKLADIAEEAGKTRIAGELRNHKKNLFGEGEGIEEVLRSLKNGEREGDKLLRNAFPKYSDKLDCIYSDIKRLRGRRDIEIKKLAFELREDGDALHDSQAYYFKSAHEHMKTYGSAVSPETIYALKAGIIARYDPRILELAKERKAVEEKMIGFAKAFESGGDKLNELFYNESRNITRDEFKALYRAARIKRRQK